MERDEILKMAQKESEHCDEREVFIQLKGYNYGMIVSAIVFIFLVILKLFRGEPMYDILAMYEATLIGFYIYKYKEEKNKKDLLLAICWGSATILNLYLVIWGH